MPFISKGMLYNKKSVQNQLNQSNQRSITKVHLYTYAPANSIPTWG
jgi:hypothetical protein